MQGNILKRDRQQFRKNEELDFRARLLMREAECIFKESEFEVDKTQKTLVSDLYASKIPPFPSSLIENEATEKVTEVHSLQSTEPELRFLRAKVKILNAEIDKQKEEQKKKAEKLKAVTNELHLIKEERDKLLQQTGVAEQKIAKFSTTLMEQSNNLKILESVKSRLSNELQAAKKEAKTSTKSTSCMEIRMNRALEEVESLKTSLLSKKEQEKEESEAQKTIIESQCALIQKLERQQTELIMAFRRQMLLCHNIQRQKQLVASVHSLNLADAKFNDLLETRKDQ